MVNSRKAINPLFARDYDEVLDKNWKFSLDGKEWIDINVPYCPQSKLSGIECKERIEKCYYKNTFIISKESECVSLYFGAVDYLAVVYVNNNFVGHHVGGYTPFEIDITKQICKGDNLLYIEVFDLNKNIAFGKQTYKENSFGCFYTPTVGIWQPVQIRYTPSKKIKEFYFYPDIKNGGLEIDLLTSNIGHYCIEAFFEGEKVGEVSGEVAYRTKTFLALSNVVLWELGKGNLYDVIISFEEDIVYSYFGLREVKYEGYDFMLNGKKVFQKLVLDQGFYPDGIYTAPKEEIYKEDIKRSLDLGFNGARFHEKVFDPKKLYYCDEAGYIIWGEFPSWGIDYSNLAGVGQFIAEWEEALRRDFNHPSIITWCPLNEVWGSWEDSRNTRDVRNVDIIYNFTKKFDSTRPCVDTSGGHHGTNTDLFDFHMYSSAQELKNVLDKLENEDILEVPLLYCKNENIKYKKGLPVNLSEYGGIAFIKDKTFNEVETVNEGAVLSEESWGYGKGENNGDTFVERYSELTKLLFSYDKLSGFCYTQLYDVEQEQNGFYCYDRSDKLTKKQKEQIKRINSLID